MWASRVVLVLIKHLSDHTIDRTSTPKSVLSTLGLRRERILDTFSWFEFPFLFLFTVFPLFAFALLRGTPQLLLLLVHCRRHPRFVCVRPRSTTKHENKRERTSCTDRIRPKTRYKTKKGHPFPSTVNTALKQISTAFLNMPYRTTRPTDWAWSC